MKKTRKFNKILAQTFDDKNNKMSNKMPTPIDGTFHEFFYKDKKRKRLVN